MRSLRRAIIATLRQCRALALLLTLALLAAGPVLAAAPIATAGRVVGDDTRTRFVLDLSTEVDLYAFTLASPYRVVVDLPEIDFKLPAGTGSEGRGLVTGWRYGGYAAGQSRLVLDVNSPVKVDKAFILPSVEGQPARLVVDLIKTTEQAFEEELRRSEAERLATSLPGQGRSDRLELPNKPRRDKPLVILDPGHGGVDSGTVAGDGVMEKDVVLALARILKNKLEATGKVAVMLTRDDDHFIPLDDRVKFARDHEADLFISIHADSEHVGEVRGATVYTLSEQASDKDAAALAAKENASDLIAGVDTSHQADDVTDILVDLTRRETRNFSLSFANGLVGDMSTTTRMIRNPRRAAGFRVLRAHDVPSALVELGYLSNEQDEKLLTSDEWRGRVADAMTQAILRYFGTKFAAVGTGATTATP